MRMTGEARGPLFYIPLLYMYSILEYHNGTMSYMGNIKEVRIDVRLRVQVHRATQLRSEQEHERHTRQRIGGSSSNPQIHFLSLSHRHIGTK
ncbi:hypothetical protein C8Q75DRAFT_739283 [Abortiporus biennis]|nr:hypothetical protein C8Q75DRAFT_739283 [Abortiporus biennis]